MAESSTGVPREAIDAVVKASVHWGREISPTLARVFIEAARPHLPAPPDLTEDELAWLESAARIRADDDISTATGSGAALKVLAFKLRGELARRDAEARPSPAEAATDKPCPEPSAEGS